MWVSKRRWNFEIDKIDENFDRLEFRIRSLEDKRKKHGRI